MEQIQPRWRCLFLLVIALLAPVGHLLQSPQIWSIAKATVASPDAHVLTEINKVLFWSGKVHLHFANNEQEYDWTQNKGSFQAYGHSNLVMIAYTVMITFRAILPGYPVANYLTERLFCSKPSFREAIGLSFLPKQIQVRIDFKYWDEKPQSRVYEVHCP